MTSESGGNTNKPTKKRKKKPPDYSLLNFSKGRDVGNLLETPSLRCLLVDRKLHYTPKMAAKIANACCVLHNIAHKANIPYTPLTPAEAARERDATEGASCSARTERPRRGSRVLSDLELGRARRQSLLQRLWTDRAIRN